jgi:hypothetical protein
MDMPGWDDDLAWLSSVGIIRSVVAPLEISSLA